MMRMTFLKAPLGVQLNRAAFAIYSVLFALPLWYLRDILTLHGWIVYGAFLICGLMGVGCSFVRFHWARWILAGLNLFLPALLFVDLSLTAWSQPMVWWAWFFCLIPLLAWLVPSVLLVVILFTDRKTGAYFALAS